MSRGVCVCCGGKWEEAPCLLGLDSGAMTTMLINVPDCASHTRYMEECCVTYPELRTLELVEEPHGEKGLLASGERYEPHVFSEKVALLDPATQYAQREGKQQKSLPDRSPGRCCNRHNVRLLLKGVDRVDIHTISYNRGGVNEKGGEIK